jgi:hypothetical protein
MGHLVLLEPYFTSLLFVLALLFRNCFHRRVSQLCHLWEVAGGFCPHHFRFLFLIFVIPVFVVCDVPHLWYCCL